MHRRRIAVLTDLDLAEHYLERGARDKALLHVSVALENATRERDECAREDCDQIDMWNQIVQDAFMSKLRILSHPG